MNPAKPAAAAVLVLLLALPLGGLAQVELVAVLGNNMVLQEGEVNLLRGTGPVGKQIWVKYKRLTTKKTTAAGPSGDWQVDLDLRRVTDKKAELLEIYIEKQKKPRVLTNVAVGNVWLVAAPTTQGVPAEPMPNPRLDPTRIRILTVTATDLDRMGKPGSEALCAWAVYPRESSEMKRIPTLIHRLAESFAEAGGYVGIIQLPVERLESSLLSSSAGQLPLGEGVANAWLRASNDVLKAEAARYDKLVAAKRLGILTNVPPVRPYGPPRHCLRAEIPDALRGSFLNFKGAIWSQP